MDDDIKVRLPATLYEYAMGDDSGRAGIAVISNDAGGFEHLGGALGADEVRSTILACLGNEDLAASEDIDRLRAQCANDEQIEKIAAAHRLSFIEWQASR